ncbi:MAG: WcaI family glycosyltransferase, partial [Caulobacteraceae bacterium]
DPYATLVEMVKLAALAAAFLVGVALGADDERARGALRAVVAVGAVYGAWAFLDHAVSPGLLYGAPRPFGPERLSASFGSGNTAATLFGALSLLSLVWLARAYARARPAGAFHPGHLQSIAPATALPLLSLAVSATCLVLTQSRAGVAASAAAALALVAAMTLADRRRGVSGPLLAAILGIVGLALATVAINFGQLQQRLAFLPADSLSRGQIYAAHWAAFLAAPWSGYGLGTFHRIDALLMTPANAFALKTIGAAHNVYLQWLEEAGVPGALAMFATVGVVAAQLGLNIARRRRIRAWLLGVAAVLALFLLHGAADYALQIPSMALFLSFLLGVGAAPAPDARARPAAMAGETGARRTRRGVLVYGMNYAPEVTGVGRYTGEIGEELAAAGWDVCVVTTPPHYPSWSAKPASSARRWRRETLSGALVYRCPVWLHRKMWGVRRLIAPASFALSSAPVAAWQILKRRPGLVIVVEPTLLVAPAALLFGKLVGARVVLHAQDLEVDAAFAVGHLRGGMAWRLAAAFERLTVARFDRVVTISRRMAERIAAKGVRAERIVVVRNWVDLGQIQAKTGASAYRAELGLAEDAFVALYSGALGAKQGLKLLLEAARRLSERPDVVFVVAGEGPMRPELEKAAAGLTNLKVLDLQPAERFGEFLALADAHLLLQERGAADLVLPSKLGGMLASGRPIVVTGEAGTELAEFLAGACAFIPPGDPAALAAAVATMASERPRDLARKRRLALARS